MNFKTLGLLVIFLFLFSVGVSFAETPCENISQECDDSSIEDIAQKEDVSCEDSSSLESNQNDEIVVNDWDELQYYCSLDDDNYTLKLKENTNYYPTNPSQISYQIHVRNNVKIIGSEGAYIGDNSSNARKISYCAILTDDNSKIGITLENITFKWINTEYGGDGVFLRMGGNTDNSIKNCYFHNITTNIGHSCIVYLKRGDALLENCTFVNCTTDFGSVSIYDPDVSPTGICDSASMVMRDCYFEGNYAKIEPGCINNCGKLTVYNTTFYRNSAFWWAGAIHTHGGANTTIYGCNFTDNVAGWNGGALYTYSYLQIYNTTFKGNNCTTNNGGGAIGACYYITTPSIYIEGCLFEDNENTEWSTGRGGAISTMDSGSLEVLNSTFIRNSAKQGPAISARAQAGYGSPSVIISGNKFINNVRGSDVLDVVVEGTPALIYDNYYLNNSIKFSKLSLVGYQDGDEYIFDVIAVLSNPASYDEDILDKCKYDVYVNDTYFQTVDSSHFSLRDVDLSSFYVVPSIAVDKSDVFTFQKNSTVFINVSDIDYGQNQIIRFNVDPSEATGNLTVTINKKAKYVVYLSDPQLDLGILKVANYNVDVVYNGDLRYFPSTSSASFEVRKVKNNIVADVADIDCGEMAVVYVTADVKGNYTVDINGTKVVVEVKSDGERGSANTPVLSVAGMYNAKVIYSNPNQIITINNAVFNVNKVGSEMKVISIDGSSMQIIGVISDVKGNRLSNATVSYVINDGERVNTTADDNGEFAVNIVNNCVVKMIFDGDGTTLASNASLIVKNLIPTKKNTIIEVPSNFDRTAVDYKAGEKGSMFYVTLKDSDGKPLAGKSVKIGIFDKIYTVKTDKDGKGGLQINVANANDYTYAISFLGDDDYKACFAVSCLHVLKKPVTITPAKTSYAFKASAKTKTVTATLKSNNAYIPKGKQVTLAIAGKTFKATIADNGKISFNIGSITAKGTYKVAIKYAGSNTYSAATSRTITVKIS